MTTAQEMSAITASFTAQGVQEVLPLVAAGYVEIAPGRPIYKPIPPK